MLLDIVDTHYKTSFKFCVTILRVRGSSEMTDEPSKGVSGTVGLIKVRKKSFGARD